jgi:hypothetical protein
MGPNFRSAHNRQKKTTVGRGPFSSGSLMRYPRQPVAYASEITWHSVQTSSYMDGA